MTLTFKLTPCMILAALLAFSACTGAAAIVQSDIPPPPDVRQEFRGAWIATVANIDWPSERGLSSARQQEELRAIFDRIVELNMNAAILQVRPAADAMYDSPDEPWSEYLTGEMGRPPEPYYDPLAFAVEEAHARGLELHAWVNPFRARHATGTSAVDEGHVSERHPDYIRRYNRQLWLDPGLQEAQEYALGAIHDIVSRYDIDGVHIDDYFYPYAERDAQGRAIVFPDEETYRRAVAAGETRPKDEWRRENVNRFVQALYEMVKQEKPHVKVGISPFGIWRPGHPEGIRGMDAFADIHADSRRWLHNGWLDYFSPQLYWAIDPPAQSYTALLDWWVGENLLDRHMWPGNFSSRVASGDNVNWSADEIIRQVEATRNQARADGNIHFSMNVLMQNRGGLADALGSGPYAEPALIPPSNWLGQPPARPSVQVEGQGATRRIALEPNGERPARWLVQIFDDGTWHTDILPANTQTVGITTTAQRIVIRSINRTAQLSDPVAIDL